MTTCVTPPPNHHRLIRTSIRVTVWCGVLAVGGILLALALYCAGIPAGPAAGRPYSFCNSYLSILGHVRGPEGLSNLPACIAFNGALVGAGLLYVWFWRGRRQFVSSPRLRRFVLVCGCLMGAGLAGIGLIPEDLNPHLHELMTLPPVGFGAAAILASILGTPAAFDGRGMHRLTLVGMVGVALAAVAVKLLAETGQIGHRPAFPTMQKVMVIVMVSWTFWQAWRMHRALPAAS
ncbi:MAG: DUF998 domain-containing protein [Lentisphaeria bacterium]